MASNIFNMYIWDMTLSPISLSYVSNMDFSFWLFKVYIYKISQNEKFAHFEDMLENVWKEWVI